MKWLPLTLFALLLVFLLAGLRLDAQKIPSPLIHQTAPDFLLPQLHSPQVRTATRELRGQVWLLNVWASWCYACREEHEIIARLSNTGALVVGLNYKDETAAAKEWLRQLGDPYRFSLVDADGRTGLDWGVYGVPETFVIDGDGVVRHKHTGPLDWETAKTVILPLLKQLRQRL